MRSSLHNLASICLLSCCVATLVVVNTEGKKTPKKLPKEGTKRDLDIHWHDNNNKRPEEEYNFLFEDCGHGPSSCLPKVRPEFGPVKRTGGGSNGGSSGGNGGGSGGGGARKNKPVSRYSEDYDNYMAARYSQAQLDQYPIGYHFDDGYADESMSDGHSYVGDDDDDDDDPMADGHNYAGDDDDVDSDPQPRHLYKGASSSESGIRKRRAGKGGGGLSGGAKGGPNAPRNNNNNNNANKPARNNKNNPARRRPKSVDSGAGAASGSKRILNSPDLSVAGSVPWTVALKRGDKVVCTGALVSPRYVVTAAHCFHHYGRTVNVTGQLRVHLGRYKIQEEFELTSQNMEIINVCIHKKYEMKDHSYKHNWNGLIYDVAVIELEKPAKLDNYVRPICLPHPLKSKPSAETLKDKCFVAGFGPKKADWSIYQDPKRREPEDYLEPTDKLKIMGYKPREKCGKYNHNWPYGIKHHSMSCFDQWDNYNSDDGVGACREDAGGPLACYDPEINRYTLHSLVSSGHPQCKRGSGSAFGANMWNLSWNTIDMILALKNKQTPAYCKVMGDSTQDPPLGIDDWREDMPLKYPPSPQPEPEDY